MKPYDRINRKAVANFAVAAVTLLIIVALLFRPIISIAMWIYGIGDYVGFAFCNPTLWLFGFDEVMWDYPDLRDLPMKMREARQFGIVILCLLSGAAHIFAVVWTFIGLSVLYKRINRIRWES